MTEEKKEENKYAGLIFLLLTFAFMVGVIWTMFYFAPEEGPRAIINEYEVVEGNVINVEPILNKDGSLNYFIVTFDNDVSYKIRTTDNVDFTVNSKIIIELKRSYWEDEEPDDFWYLKQIIKAPNNLELG